MEITEEMIVKTFDPARIPDWIRTLAVLRRNSMRWPPLQMLIELASDGHCEGHEIAGTPGIFMWQISRHGLKSLAAWEKLNGFAEDAQRIQRRPGVTVKAAFDWAASVLSFETRTAEERAAYQQICDSCDQVKTDEAGNWCAACGCGVSSRDKQVFNLCSYREPYQRPETPAIRLCKHPKRDKGKGWPLTPITVGGQHVA